MPLTGSGARGALMSTSSGEVLPARQHTRWPPSRNRACTGLCVLKNRSTRDRRRSARRTPFSTAVRYSRGFASALQVDGCVQLVSYVRVTVGRYCRPAGLRESRVLDRKPGVAAIHVEQEKLTSRGRVNLDVPPPERGGSGADQQWIAQLVNAVRPLRQQVELQLVSFHRRQPRTFRLWVP